MERKLIIMISGCKKCMALGAVLFLAFGVLFLLRDLNVWNFWNIQWWTVLFLLVGMGKLGHSKCSECQAMTKEKKK